MFRFKNVSLDFSDYDGIGVWFDCQPEYISDIPITLETIDVDKLKEGAQTLLHDFISHLWMLSELGIDITLILDSVAQGKHLDIEALMSYYNINNEQDNSNDINNI